MKFQLEIAEEIASTNAALLERSDISGIALLALRQSAGVGRRGRSWETLSGNLALSYGLMLHSAEKVSLLPFITGIALYDSVQFFLQGAPVACGLKWPNDLYLDGRKLAGLLVQARQQGDSVKVVVGIGLNLQEAPEGVRIPAVALAEFLPPSQLPTPESFARHFLERLEKSFQNYVQFPEIQREWSVRCAHLGRPIFYAPSGAESPKRCAIALELLPSGELLVREESGAESALSSEEVSLSL